MQRFLPNFFFCGVFGQAGLYLDSLCCVALCFVVCLVLHRVVICPLLVSQLVCWLKISQFSCTFVAQLDTTTRQKGKGSTSSNSSTTLSNTAIVYSPQAITFLFPWRFCNPDHFWFEIFLSTMFWFLLSAIFDKPPHSSQM